MLVTEDTQTSLQNLILTLFQRDKDTVTAFANGDLGLKSVQRDRGKESDRNFGFMSFNTCLRLLPQRVRKTRSQHYAPLFSSVSPLLTLILPGFFLFPSLPFHLLFPPFLPSSPLTTPHPSSRPSAKHSST